MALDKKLLTLAPDLPVAGIIRFYWFDPPAVTLGRFQKADVINRSACEADGIAVVRRATGGRAVFHKNELTYSLVLPIDNPCFGGGVTASFQGIAKALKKGLANLGLAAEIEKRRSGRDHQREADCFLSAGRYEIKLAGLKLLGSAQVREKGYLLQHGSIYLQREPGEAGKYLSGKASGLLPSEPLVADLRAALGRQVLREEVKAALLNGFRESWGIQETLTSLPRPVAA